MSRGLDGNLAYRLETPAGPVVQKLYLPRKGRWREGLRAAAGVLRRAKTSPRAAVRRATEAAQLDHWREAGFEVPRLVAPAEAGLAPGPYNLIAWVEGPVLLAALRPGSVALPRVGSAPAPAAAGTASDDGLEGTLGEGTTAALDLDGRRRLLAAYAGQWQARHAAALERDDPRLLQEHGSFDHVLVSGEHFVTIDHEQAFRPGAATLPAVAKEFASALRSLLKGLGPTEYAALLPALVEGYADRELLATLVSQITAPPSAGWRVLRGLDRWREARRGSGRGKFVALAALRAVLDG